MALSLTKIYLILYSLIEYGDKTMESLKNLIKKLCYCCKENKKNSLK